MRYEIAQITTPQTQCQRLHHVGKLAIVALNQTSTLLETTYPQHLYPHWQSTQHTLRIPVQHYDPPRQLRCRTTIRYLFVLLLRLLVAIVGYINNLQLRSLLNLNPFRATPPCNYNPPKPAASHQAVANQPASQTPTYNYDDNHLNYDAPCNLRQQPDKRKRQSRPFCLNGMSLYRGYFAPGGMDPTGTTSGNELQEAYDFCYEKYFGVQGDGAPNFHNFHWQLVLEMYQRCLEIHEEMHPFQKHLATPKPPLGVPEPTPTVSAPTQVIRPSHSKVKVWTSTKGTWSDWMLEEERRGTVGDVCTYKRTRTITSTGFATYMKIRLEPAKADWGFGEFDVQSLGVYADRRTITQTAEQFQTFEVCLEGVCPSSISSDDPLVADIVDP